MVIVHGSLRELFLPTEIRLIDDEQVSPVVLKRRLRPMASTLSGCAGPSDRSPPFTISEAMRQMGKWSEEPDDRPNELSGRRASGGQHADRAFLPAGTLGAAAHGVEPSLRRTDGAKASSRLNAVRHGPTSGSRTDAALRRVDELARVLAGWSRGPAVPARASVLAETALDLARGRAAAAMLIDRYQEIAAGSESPVDRRETEFLARRQFLPALKRLDRYGRLALVPARAPGLHGKREFRRSMRPVVVVLQNQPIMCGAEFDAGGRIRSTQARGRRAAAVSKDGGHTALMVRDAQLRGAPPHHEGVSRLPLFVLPPAA